MNSITVTHNGVAIDYLEDQSKWRAVIRGRERLFPDLKSAKESVDKPPPKSKDDSFQPCEAWYNSHHGFVKVRVTSTAEVPSWRRSGIPDFWIVIPPERTGHKPDRRKASGEALFLDTTGNQGLIAAIGEEQAKVEAAMKEQERLLRKLSKIKAPKETL